MSSLAPALSEEGKEANIYILRGGHTDPDPPQTGKKRQKEKHREHRFKEGWVEFMNKKVARSVAEMLNANNIGTSICSPISLCVCSTVAEFSFALLIGGKKGSRWRDDVWTMKYLPRFRWDMLSEQVGESLNILTACYRQYVDLLRDLTALERATQTSLLRFHLQNTRTEQETYLQAVEKSRVKTAIETKAEGRRETKRTKGEVVEEVVIKKRERERTYRQREAVVVAGSSSSKVKGDLTGVLSRLF